MYWNLLDEGNSRSAVFDIQVFITTGRGPIIANLHVTRECTQIFGSFFADNNNKWWQSRQQNPTFVSWLIQMKSGKTPLETIPLYISLTGESRKRSGDASRYY
jgi:hypothetical protein